MISCKEAVNQLWAYLDDDLDAEDRARIDDHLELCQRCCGEAEFTTALQDLLLAAAGPDLPAEVEEHLNGFLDGLETESP